MITKKQNRPAWFGPIGIGLVIISLVLLVIGVMSWVQISFERGFYNVLIGTIGMIVGALVALKRL